MLEALASSVVALAALILVNIGLVVYRLQFYPLAYIPGPKIAAATRWFKFYYDILKYPFRQYMYKVNRMHQQYGASQYPCL